MLIFVVNSAAGCGTPDLADHGQMTLGQAEFRIVALIIAYYLALCRNTYRSDGDRWRVDHAKNPFRAIAQC